MTTWIDGGVAGAPGIDRGRRVARTGDPAVAEALRAAAESLDLTDADRAALADEFAHVTELVDQG